MDITITAGFSKERIESFYKFHYKRISNYKYLEYTLVVFFLLLTIVLIEVFESLTGAIISCSVAFGILFTYSYRIYLYVKRELKKNPFNSFDYTIRFTDDFVYYNKDTTYSWDDFKMFVEVDTCYYLYITKSKALVIPKFSFQKDEKEKLVEFVIKKKIYRKYRFYSVEEVL